MSVLDLSTVLAGIDTSLVSSPHFDSSYSPTSPTSLSFTLDLPSYATMPRAKSGSARTRYGRSPLVDRSSDFNLGSVLDITNSRASFATYQDRDKDLRRTSSRNRISRTSTSFHPLPPVLSASSLQLPSLPDFSVHQISNTSTALGPPPVLPSPIFPPLLSQPILFPNELKPNPNLEEKYRVPAFQHPNSPYVPWALPVRLEILRPLTPASERRILSRTGTGGPTTVLNHPGNPTDKSTKGWRNLRHAVRKNVHHVAKRIVGLKKPSSKTISTSVDLPEEPRAGRNKDGRDGTVSTYSMVQTRYRASLTSLDSADTATLANWLAARQRMNERYDPDRLITLEDYELKGSWLNVSRARSPLAGYGGLQELDALPSRRPSERRSKTSLRQHTSLMPLNENAVTVSFSQLPPRLEFAPISPLAGPGEGSLGILAEIGLKDSTSDSDNRQTDPSRNA